MLVRMEVPYCDFDDVAYLKYVDGGGYLAQGASERWCVVMYAGPDRVRQHVDAGGKLYSYEEAVAKCLSIGGSIDF